MIQAIQVTDYGAQVQVRDRRGERPRIGQTFISVLEEMLNAGYKVVSSHSPSPSATVVLMTRETTAETAPAAADGQVLDANALRELKRARRAKSA